MTPALRAVLSSAYLRHILLLSLLLVILREMKGHHCGQHHKSVPSAHGLSGWHSAASKPVVRTRRRHVAAMASLSVQDLDMLKEAAVLSTSSAGLTGPHPNSACILVSPDGRPLSSAHLRASGAPSAELQAVQAAQGASSGSTAYLNLEPGDCHGEDVAVRSLIDAGVSRVVIGLRHPLPHARGQAIKALRTAGVSVDVLGEAALQAPDEAYQSTRHAVLEANEPLLHRAAKRRPLSILKYAMTLDGKIATQQGHSAWVTSPPARAMVFEARARSDAVIVGGNTVRRDNPRLTTRKDSGHAPVRIVMSRTLDLPADAALWDVSVAPTIVATQRGARTSFQAKLRSLGVEVVEFDFLTPEAVADYCYSRGFLQCFWECGGTLAAPCIASSVVHKVLAFVAPKVIGGARAPTPVGELGFVEMTQAVSVLDYTWQQVGPDLMLTGYLPASGGLQAIAAELESATSELLPHTPPANNTPDHPEMAATATASTSATAATAAAAPVLAAAGGRGGAAVQVAAPAPKTSSRLAVSTANATRVVPFYKAWDKWGALSNFSPHAVTLPHYNSQVQSSEMVALQVLGPVADAPAPAPQPGSLAVEHRNTRVWPTVEHYYQAQKFAGNGHAEAAALVEAIAAAGSPEEAARVGRRAERSQPHLLTPGWQRIKVDVMFSALRAKFSSHPGPRNMLLATCAPPGPAARLVEASPNDFFWGAGYNGGGRNVLGQLLAHVRNELRATN